MKPKSWKLQDNLFPVVADMGCPENGVGSTLPRLICTDTREDLDEQLARKAAQMYERVHLPGDPYELGFETFPLSL